jgi:broad specificity polyphosphatase/5'/3'-nucleotidase SurE
MAVRFLLTDKPPNLVISGINRGQNLADDVTQLRHWRGGNAGTAASRTAMIESPAGLADEP